MKAVIVDNEHNIVDALQRLLAVYCPEVDIVGKAYSVREAHRLLNRTKTDLLFLDIELDDGTGMDLLRRFGKYPFQVIFVTAYDQYAVEAFRFSAVDFLLKPVDPDDLVEAVRKAGDRRRQHGYEERLLTLEKNLRSVSARTRKLIINDKQHMHAFTLDEIFCLEAEGAYTHFHLQDRSILSSKNLKHYERLLNDYDFERVHHSFLVNLVHMAQFEKNDSVLLLANGRRVPVSTRKREGLISRLRELGLT